MSRPRVLYIDVPFEHEAGGDKNRSRFLWRTLEDAFDAELLLVVRDGGPSVSRPRSAQVAPVLTLTATKAALWQSDSVFAFAAPDRAAYERLLQERRYDAVFTRFHSPWELARMAHRHPTKPAVVVDLDMVSSRLVALTWRQQPSFKNRWFLFERLKLGRFERRLFRQPFLVLFSNPVEMEEARTHAAPDPLPGCFAVTPNVMPDAPALADAEARPVVLFFGSMNSGANTDAFRFLMDEVLPRLDADLRRHGVRIQVVGKNPPPWFTDRVKASGSDRVLLVGGVDSMERAIAESRFVLLPLRVASGTRTRILEAAAQARSVVTTAIGAEGIDVGDDAMVRDDAEGLAEAVRRLLDEPALAHRLGRQLHDRCSSRYAPDHVARELVREVGGFIAARKEARP